MSHRNYSTVRCNFENNIRPCNPIKKPCLFHIIKDPCEQVNLNYKPNRKMKIFVQRKIDYFEKLLNTFRKSSSKPLNIKSTKYANPNLFNNTWSNWEDQDYLSK